MKRSWRKRAGDMLALLVGLVIAVLLAEGLVRVVRPAPSTANHPPVRRNQIGYRDADHALAKPPDVVRIAFVGDSYTFGAGVVEEDRFSNVVARRLDAEWPQVRVEALNFGSAGADVATAARRLRTRVPSYDPDAVVYGFVLNDFASPAALDAYHERHAELERQYERDWWWLEGAARRSQAADLVNTLVKFRYSGIRENQIDYLSSLYQPGPLLARGLHSLRQTLAEMAKVQRGIVVFFPYFLKDEAELEFYRRARYLVREATEKRGLTFIELLPYLAHRPYYEWWTSDDDHHPNAAAHRIAADLIVDALLEGAPLADTAPR